MGPYYSNLGGAQAAVRAGATGKLVVASPDQPGMDFNNTSVEDLANIEGMDFEGILEVGPDRRPRPRSRSGSSMPPARAAVSC